MEGEGLEEGSLLIRSGGRRYDRYIVPFSGGLMMVQSSDFTGI